MFGFYPNNCLVNYYPNGDSTMGWHSDNTKGMEFGTGVAIFTIGGGREILFRDVLTHTDKFSVPLADNSLLYIANYTQLVYNHSIPKASTYLPRISLSFRKLKEE